MKADTKINYLREKQTGIVYASTTDIARYLSELQVEGDDKHNDFITKLALEFLKLGS